MKFQVGVRETLVTTREVEADTIEEAKELVKQMYEGENIILSADDFTGDVDVKVYDEMYIPLEDWDENFIR